MSAKVTDNLSTDGAGEVGSADWPPPDFFRPLSAGLVLRIPALIFRSIVNLGGLGLENRL